MGLLIPCVLLLVLSGDVFATEVVNGAFGRYVYFNESISDQTLGLFWNFKGTQIASRFPGLSPGCTPQYAGRCQMYDNGTLRLDNLTSADEGTYTFNAIIPPSTNIKSSIYDLRIYPILNAPVLSRNDTSDNLIGGTYVSLHCNASGQTVTTYTFYRDGKNICSESHVKCQDSYLYFQPITGNDTGLYTCTIQNPVSSNTSNSIQLNVIDPVSDVKITSNITGLVWPGLDLVSLTCSARGTDVTYSWSLQGAPLPQDPRYHLTESNTVLTISPVTDNDNGTFTCTANNILGNQTSNGISFELASRVSAVTLTSNTSGSYIWVGEDSVSLNCSANGSNVTFGWQLNGKPLPSAPPYSQGDSPHSNLIISPISRDDSGPFTCEASNLLNSETSNALNFSLAWKPEENITCSATGDGQHITLGCSWSGGHPAANMSLNFNGRTENGTNKVTSQVPLDDAKGKDLTCHGEQLDRKTQCTLRIGLPEDPGHDNNADTNTKVGEPLTLTVTLEPGLPATFSWSYTATQRQGFSVTSTNFSSSLRIPSVTADDAGTYECKAQNIIGTQSFRFKVNVDENIVHSPKPVLSDGAIAGIVIGVLAGVALIGIAVFFIMKKKKRSGDNRRLNEPEDQLGTTVTYATVQKKNGVAETSLTNNHQEDDVNYAQIKFPKNKSAMATVPPPVETEYSTVKPSIKQ